MIIMIYKSRELRVSDALNQERKSVTCLKCFNITFFLNIFWMREKWLAGRESGSEASNAGDSRRMRESWRLCISYHIISYALQPVFYYSGIDQQFLNTERYGPMGSIW